MKRDQIELNPTTKNRGLTIGIPSMFVRFGSAEYESGSVQGYVQVVVWKLSTQLSVKWL